MRAKASFQKQWWNLVTRHSISMVKIGGLGFAICLGYFLYALYGGGLQTADPQRAYRLIAGFGRALVGSSLILSVGLVIVTIEEVAYAVVMGICALGLIFGWPSIVANNLGALSARLDEATTELSSAGVEAGIAVMSVVGIRIVYEIYIQIRDLPKRRAEPVQVAPAPEKEKAAGLITPLSPCWELPYCHEWLQESCGAYQAKKACWRYGSGCYCDPGMFEDLIELDLDEQDGFVDLDERPRQRYARADLQASRAAGTQRTKSCRECPIFAEHQRIKFRYVTPILIGGLVIAVAAFYGYILKLWGYIAQQIVIGAAAVALGQFEAENWFRVLNSPVVTLIVVAFLVLMAISYILRFTEWAIITKKIV